MRCIVYRGRHGLLLVPDCMRASVEAEREYGPLLRCGEIETDRLDPTLVRDIDDALEYGVYALGEASLALRHGYQALADLPLPEGFSWHLSDFWEEHPEAWIVHDASAQVVGEVHADRPQYTWRVMTNTHRPWLFRGSYVANAQAVAMQYLAMWVSEHAWELQRTAMRVSGGSAPARPAQ